MLYQMLRSVKCSTLSVWRKKGEHWHCST